MLLDLGQLGAGEPRDGDRVEEGVVFRRPLLVALARLCDISGLLFRFACIIVSREPGVTELDDVAAAAAHHEEQLAEREAVRLGPVPARVDRVVALVWRQCKIITLESIDLQRLLMCL